MVFCLSNKNSPAPFIYVVLQIGFLTGFVILSPAIIDFKEAPETVLFWLNCFVVFVLYFWAHLKDPGYVTHDALFLTNQGAPISDPSKERTVVDSTAKHKSKGIRYTIETEAPISTMVPEGKEKGDRSRQYFRKLQEENHIVSEVSTNFGIMTNMMTEVISPEKNLGERNNIDQQANQNYQFQQDQNDIIACEPSMEQGEESLQNQNILNFNVGSQEIENIESEHSPSKQMQNQVEFAACFAETPKRDFQETPTETPSRKSGKRKQRIVLNQDNSPEFKSNSLELVKIGSRPTTYDNELSLREFRGTPQKIKQASHLENTISPPPKEADEPLKSSERKFMKNEIQTELQTEVFHTRHSSTTKDLSKDIILNVNRNIQNGLENFGEDLLFVERRYCTVCGIEQPLRTKHCKDCDRCIAQYDHHCPWLGTCIGEKNHLPFYWFLVFQFIQLAWAEYNVIKDMLTGEYRNWTSDNAARIFIMCCFTFFLIMVFCLLAFHTYLAIVNLTSWESMSWYKISYLKEWHEDWGSPFSKGIKKNLKFFCCYKSPHFYHWEMPKYKRPLDDQ